MAEEKKQHVCDCGCEHDHHDCDCGCNHDEDVVMLQDESGKEIPFHYITTMEHEGKEYVFLQSADPEEDDLIVEIFELQAVEEDGEMYDCLYPIDDELYDVLYNKLMQEIAENANDEE